MRLSLLVLLLLATSAFAAPKATVVEPREVVLQFQPQPGDKLRQSIGMKMQMTMTMLPGPNTGATESARIAELSKTARDMSMDMKMVMRIEASEADAKGDYLLHLRGEDGQLNMTLPGGESKVLPNPLAGLEIDTLRHANLAGIEILRVRSSNPAIKDEKALDGMAQSMMDQAFGAMRGLEGRHMKVGESAEIPFNMQMPMQQLPANAKVNATMVFTLKAIRKGTAYFDTSMKMTMDMEVDAQQAQKTHAELKGSGTGTMEYGIANRLATRQDMVYGMLMDMKMPGDVSMQMDTRMQMHMKAERLR